MKNFFLSIYNWYVVRKKQNLIESLEKKMIKHLAEFEYYKALANRIVGSFTGERERSLDNAEAMKHATMYNFYYDKLIDLGYKHKIGKIGTKKD